MMSKRDYARIAGAISVSRAVDAESRKVLAREFANMFGAFSTRFNAIDFISVALQYDQPPKP